MQGVRVRTWAPRGQTPVLQHHLNWQVLSAAERDAGSGLTPSRIEVASRFSAARRGSGFLARSIESRDPASPTAMRVVSKIITFVREQTQ